MTGLCGFRSLRDYSYSLGTAQVIMKGVFDDLF
jgi:hypothetical protein